MAEEKFDALIVGAGPAGSTAAYLMAKAGLEVLLVERGPAPGSKNMFGGRMYGHALNRIIPGFWEEAPVERPVTRETITFLDGEKSVSLNCRDTAWGRPPYHSFTLLRAEFDAWLASRAEEEGAILATGIRVDEPLLRDGKVAGIAAGDDEILADVVVAADGVNSLLAQKAGLCTMFAPRQVGTGVKQVIALPPDVIDSRFQVDAGDGAVHMFVGDCTEGLPGGGFLYTNKNTVSLGVVVGVAALAQSELPMSRVLEGFKAGPHVAPLIEGGEVVEYSAHLVPEAGLGMLPRLFGDGMLVTGDAAGLVVNLGYVIRGMDFAIASGAAAAETVIAAKAAGDFSAQGLSGYEKSLQDGFVLRDLEAYRLAPRFMENERLYTTYPKLAAGLASKLFEVDGRPSVHLLSKVMGTLKDDHVSWWNLAMDGWKGGRHL